MSLSKVSIIIPLFNAINCIADTLDSINNQSHTNLEIIVIEDGSTDGSFEFLESVQFKYNLILKKNKGKGACAARNYGFELATGDYIQYLDADDILSPNKIKAQLELAQRYGKETIYSCSWLHFNTTIQDANIKRQAIDKDYAKPYEWLNDAWLGKGMGQTSIWLTHRDLIAMSGGWNESLSINQDGEFFSRILIRAKAIKFVDQSYVYYRIGNSTSLSQSSKYKESKAESLLKSYSLYHEHAIEFNIIDTVKEGLATNYLSFIYIYYNYFPDLILTAQQQFHALGYKKMWPVGGHNFKRIAKVIGFKNALALKGVFKKQ
jgi:glycosyltransferase involved in cell wall biosynthesis